MINEILATKINDIDKSNIEAIGLMGSYSRGEEKEYSDVDIVCILKKGREKKAVSIEIIERKYVVTSYVTLEEMEKCFTEPDSAVENILGLQQARILFDPNNIFNNLRKRAINFKWTKELQQKANDFASRELAGWIEEVHKALQGLISNDEGRMLNGLFGLTYGLFKILRVQKGILLNGENTFYNKVIEYYGSDSSFTKLSERAFGICKNSGIKERAEAGLLLFYEVTEGLMEILRDEDKPAVVLAKQEIQRELAHKGYIVKQGGEKNIL